MKKIKLTEETLVRIVGRVIKEQEKEVENKDLMGLINQLTKDPENEELKTKIAELTKKLGLPVTNKAKKELDVLKLPDSERSEYERFKEIRMSSCKLK